MNDNDLIWETYVNHLEQLDEKLMDKIKHGLMIGAAGASIGAGAMHHYDTKPEPSNPQTTQVSQHNHHARPIDHYSKLEPYKKLLADRFQMGLQSGFIVDKDGIPLRKHGPNNQYKMFVRYDKLTQTQKDAGVRVTSKDEFNEALKKYGATFDPNRDPSKIMSNLYPNK
mgnify:CR=1 FL=1